MEAQRFPEDYDGIIAGAPAYRWTGLFTDFVWNAQVAGETGSGDSCSQDARDRSSSARAMRCPGWSHGRTRE